MIKKLSIFLLPFLLVLSCASKDEKLQNIKDYVEKISNEIKFEDGFDAIKVRGEKRSRFRSYYQNDELVFINEDMNIGNRGNSANKYYLRNNTLVYYSEQSLIMKDDSLKIKSKSMIRTEIYFSGNETIQSERILQGNSLPLTDAEIKSIIEHYNILKELADINKPIKME
jgi:hypothetical protein